MDYESIFREQLGNLDLSGMEAILCNDFIPKDLKSLVSVKDIVTNMLTGKEIISFEKIIYILKSIVLGELNDILILAGELLIICIITGLLAAVVNGFGSDTVSETATVVSLFMAAGISMSAFYEVYLVCHDAVKAMTDLMLVSFPVVFGLTVASGGATSGTVMDTVLSGSVTAFSTIVLKILLPLVFISCILVIVNSVSKKNYVKKLSQFMRNGALFCTGFLITIFSGLSVIQGMMTKSADNILLNTARYSIDNFVPFVGRFTADSLEMVLTCIRSVRNGVGIAGIIILIIILLVPLVKAVLITIVFKITAIILEPAGNDRIADCMGDMGQASMMLVSMLLLSSMMFIIFFGTVVKFAPGG